MRISILVAALGVTTAALAQTGVAAQPKVTSPSKASFVFDRLHTRYRFEDNGANYKEVNARIHILDEKGSASWHELTFDYKPFSERLEIPYVRVQRGTVVSDVPISEVRRRKFPREMRDFPDEKKIALPPLLPGDVVEYQVRIVKESSAVPGQFWVEHRFESPGVVSQQLEVELPAKRRVKTKATTGVKAWITEQGGYRIYHWSPSPALFSEHVDVGPPWELVPDVQLTSFQNWEQIGQWYAEIESEHRTPSPEILEKVHDLTKGLSSELEKVQALYNFTAKQIKYVSLVSLGVGGYEPHSAEETLHRTAGDCKDKAILLEALIESTGIEPSSVLISTNHDIDHSFPTPSAFNHVISTLTIGNNRIWMDPSSQVMPFGMLGYQVRGKEGLVVSASHNSQLSKTPIDASIPSTWAESVDGNITEDGILDVKVNVTATGDVSIPMREAFLGPVESMWPWTVKGVIRGLERSDQVDELEISPPLETDAPFSVSFRLRRTGSVLNSGQGNKLQFPLSDFPLPSAETMAGAEYFAPGLRPFRIGAPTKYSYKASLGLPTHRRYATPRPVAIERDFAAYNASYVLSGNKLKAERQLITRKDEMVSAAAREYEDFRNRVMMDEGKE